MEKIAILTGGDSAEYNISLLSAKTVQKHLEKTKYKSTIVHLKNGKYTIDNIKLDTTDFSYNNGKTKQTFDKIFIALHGPPAENGLIQDYFESINLPYNSCNAHVSSLTFDKFECNKTLKKFGFRCAKSIAIYSDMDFSKDEILDMIGIPCFVKPNGAGSSYGISKVSKKAHLSKAIKKAFLYDNKVIIESCINGTEVSCGVYSDKNKIIALPITEIISENNFFDYEAKYKGKAEEITPARINQTISSEIKKTTKNIYKKMNLSGVCRIDFIIKNNKPYIIEINTIPGLTEDSIIPKQLKAANISLSDFFDLCLKNVN